MKILLAFGTRPEAIKMLPLYWELKKHKGFKTKIVVTGQHTEMLETILQTFSTEPEYNLRASEKSQNLITLTNNILDGMRLVFEDFKPNLILVHGDTTTTFASALSAFYSGIDIGHVEAGLRTHDIHDPWPEEGNRQLTARLAKWHFAPTKKNKQNLIKEGIKSDSIYVTGNTVIDALNIISKRLQTDKDLISLVRNEVLNSELKINLEKKFILITIHRRESFGKKIKNIFSALKKVAEQSPDVYFVFPVHLNPEVNKPAYDILKGLKNMILINPLSYPTFIYLMKKSYLIITDSGGIQEEAPAFGKPVLLIRDKTERIESLEDQTVKLISTSPDKITEEVKELIFNRDKYTSMLGSQNVYGTGNASKKIVRFIRTIK